MVCTSCFHAIFVSSPSVRSSANWASSLASAPEPGRSPSPSEKLTSYCFMMSQMSSKCSYRKLSRWCEMHHLAMIEPPRETMPVRRLAVRWMKDSRTPAWMVK
jgi:hypothetical protein